MLLTEEKKICRHQILFVINISLTDERKQIHFKKRSFFPSKTLKYLPKNYIELEKQK